MINNKLRINQTKLLALGLVLLLIGCQAEKEKSPISNIDLVTKESKSSEPSLHKSDEGTVYLSWIETATDKMNYLKFATLQDEMSWSTPVEIAKGDNWFVNWADFPSLTSFGNNLAAHYLAKSADGTYTYDVHLKLSNNQGKTWNKDFIPHHDGTQSEHGFVSKLALSNDTFLSVWLDGRQYAYAQQDSTILEEMTLRAAAINGDNQIEEAYLLDARVCDCCQTDTAMTEEGPIVVYRDRSEGEIRDIFYVKMVNDEWTAPKPIANDGWHIAGCPVNGPAISALENKVAVAWYTAAEGQPKVKVAFSLDNGHSFYDPVEVDHQKSIGRIDLELLADGTALVCWMDTVNEDTVIQLQKIKIDGKKGELFTVATSSESRSSGFPRIAIHNDSVIVAYTSMTETSTEVKTLSVDLDAF